MKLETDCALSPIDHKHTEVGQQFLRPDVDVRVGNCVDADNAAFADLAEKTADSFVKVIMANFHTIDATDGLGPDLPVRFLGRNFERRWWFSDEAFAGFVTRRHFQMHFHFCGGRGGNGAGFWGGLRGGTWGRRLRDGDFPITSWTVDFSASAGTVNGQFLLAFLTIENNFHKLLGSLIRNNRLGLPPTDDQNKISSRFLRSSACAPARAWGAFVRHMAAPRGAKKAAPPSLVSPLQ